MWSIVFFAEFVIVAMVVWCYTNECFALNV